VKKRELALLLFGLLAVFSVLTYVQAAPDPAATTPAKPNPPAAAAPVYKLNANELKALELLNADRQAANLPPLVINLTLSKLAADYAIDMNNRKFFNHVDPDGKDPFDRMAAVGIDFPNAGENIAVSPDVATAHKMLFNSPKHKENILNPKFTEVGIGVRPDSRGGVYLVQEFIGP
jgi:uncharacterized protein YkwD